MKTYGRLDVLVNNAGIAPIADIEATTVEMWRKSRIPRRRAASAA